MYFPFLLKDVNSKKDDVMRHFMNAMHSIANVTGKDVATAFNLSRFRTACDVGGGCFAYIFYSWNIVIVIIKDAIAFLPFRC